jgi:ACDE family multidrug resistance protein
MQGKAILSNTNFQIVCSVSLLTMMMVAGIVPAFPSIMQRFGIGEQAVGLLITGFSLPAFLFGPIGGVIADRLGRKRVLVVSLLLFGIFGGACAFATNFTTLMILRIVQGIGSAPMGSVGVTIISDIFSGNDRARALGFNNTVMYTGYIIFPMLGGALAGLAWNYPFLLFIVALPLGLIALLYLKVPEPENVQKLGDYLGKSVKYLRSWKVAWLFAATILTYILLYGAFLVYFIILLSSKFKADPFVTGIFVSMIGVFTALASTQVGRLSSRFPSTAIIMSAFILYALSVVLVPLMPGLWLCLIPPIIFGIAHGLNLPSLTVIASRVTPLENRAGFMAIQTTMIPLGMTLAAPLIGLFSSLTDMDTAFYIAGGVAMLIPVASVFMLRGRGLRT